VEEQRIVGHPLQYGGTGDRVVSEEMSIVYSQEWSNILRCKEHNVEKQGSG
jgi:hypothetical protein